MRYSTQLEHGKKIPLHDEEGFIGMRAAGRIAADTLDYITPFVKPGVSTAKLDALCEEFMRAAGAIPGTIDYHGYKHASCISVNHVVTHGIPSETKILKVGDILNIDVTPKFNGWFGDTSRTFKVGAVSILANRLVNTAYEAMMAGIHTVRPGATLGDVGAAIEAVAKAQGFSSVRDFCGHGVGQVGLFFRARLLRPWCGPGLPRHAASAALWPRRHGHRARTGHDFHDRTDAQRGQLPG